MLSLPPADLPAGHIHTCSPLRRMPGGLKAGSRPDGRPLQSLHGDQTEGNGGNTAQHGQLALSQLMLLPMVNLIPLQACGLGTYWDGFGEPSATCKVRRLQKPPAQRAREALSCPPEMQCAAALTLPAAPRWHHAAVPAGHLC